MQGQSETKRIKYIDTIKGFAILLVVMGHAIAWQFDNFLSLLGNANDYRIYFWWLFIYSFHMPLFMFVSGYLFHRKTTGFKDEMKYLWRRIHTLVLPYISVTLLYYLIWGG